MSNVPVYYYQLKPNTSQYDRALELNQEAEEFVKMAQAFADRNGADAWELSINIGAPFGLSADPKAGEICFSRLRYIDDAKVSLNWETRQDRDRIVLPLRPLVMNEGFTVRFYQIEDDILLAVKAEERATRPRLAVADPMTVADVVTRLQSAPSWHEMGCKIKGVMPTLGDRVLEDDLQTSPLDRVGGFTLHWGVWSRVHAPLARFASKLSPEKEAALDEAEQKREYRPTIIRSGYYSPGY